MSTRGNLAVALRRKGAACVPLTDAERRREHRGPGVRRGLRARAAAHDLRGDGWAPRDGDPPGPAAAGEPAAARARAGGPAADLPLDPPPRADHARPERPPR